MKWAFNIVIFYQNRLPYKSALIKNRKKKMHIFVMDKDIAKMSTVLNSASSKQKVVSPFRAWQTF